MTEDLSHDFAEALLEGECGNELLGRVLDGVGRSLAVPRQVLYDYDEHTDTFDLLYFSGYPADARSELGRSLRTLDVRRALTERDPYWPDAPGRQLIVPLYFQEMLEAVLLLEGPEGQAIDRDLGGRDLKLVSRFLGLLMSSNRLPVNQQRQTVKPFDLERAREVQSEYLPPAHHVCDAYEIFGYNQPAAVVGGDYFDYFHNRPRTVQGVVADACGHGLAAALIMSTFRGLLQADVWRHDDLSELFTRLNRRLYCGRGMLQYLTSIFFDYHDDERRLRYFNAGHFEPIIIHADGSHSALPGGGPPLGMLRGSVYQLTSARVRPGDLLMLFTDGLVDLQSPGGDFFGPERALAAVLDRRHLPLPELADEVRKQALQFSPQAPPEDDLTLFLMRFL